MTATEILISGILPTVTKFAYIASRLGLDAAQVYHTASGLTPPDGSQFGRFYDSGNPLAQYRPFNGSVGDLINEAVVLRGDLHTALVNLVFTAKHDDISIALAPAVYAAFDALMNCAGRAKDQINIMGILAGFVPPKFFVGDDTVGDTIQSLAARVAVLIRIAALTNMARASAIYIPTSAQDALDVRNRIAGFIEAEMRLLSQWFNDDDLRALNTLRLAVVRDLNNRGFTLPPLISVNRQQNLPSLVVAFQLYQDASVDLEPDLVARNDVPNPGFMPITMEAISPNG